MAARSIHSLAICIAVIGMALVSSTTALAQPGGPGGGGGGAGGGANDPLTGGVEIDATGTLHSRILVGGNPALNRQRAEAAYASMNKDLRKKSKMRWISLIQLEKQVQKHIAAGEPLPPEVKFLAGLQRITHVFYFPERKDIVIGGPAEGFFVNGDNRVVGLKSGLPTLHLQDLVVALRAFGPEGRSPRVISCSIDPTPEGLQRMKHAYAQVQRSGFQASDAAGVVNLFQQALGMQKITVAGVSPNTRFAQIMVDADYHMKLIGIGLERPPVKITSFIEKATPNSVAKNSLQRWYFQPNYECVHVTEDENGMELVGDGVKLVGADESVANGVRKQTGSVNRASKTFCNSFTKMYDELSEKAPLFAELRNMIDLSIVAAFVKEMDYYGQSGWNMELFGDESKFPVEVYNSPTQVAPAINAVWKGRYFMTPIGGGVNIQPRIALTPDRMKTDERGKINEIKGEVDFSNLAEGQWWWD